MTSIVIASAVGNAAGAGLAYAGMWLHSHLQIRRARRRLADLHAEHRERRTAAEVRDGVPAGYYRYGRW